MAEENLSFEQALVRLEMIIKSLESGNTPLDQSLELYEEGVALVRQCNGKLDNASQRIKVLSRDSEGEITEVDFGAQS
ncbi:MAG: exodeoxyribonuclease VII small subunit [Eubacteriales bacterium]